MAVSGLLLLLDDMTALLDDVAALTKLTTQKTAGVLGDDLALNAEQVTGVRPERELPVVWAVAKGSLLNKAILVPAALLISAFAAWAINVLLMLGGAFLCFEGLEKVVHALSQRRSAGVDAEKPALAAYAAEDVDPVAFERDKVRGAIRTDFILSAEIIVISLGIVAGESLTTQVGVLIAISLLMTVGVYGLVAGIVKLDDVGMLLSRRQDPMASLGRGLLIFSPYLMKLLSFAGTLAMFLVGGGIVAHGIPPLHHWLQPLLDATGPYSSLLSTVANLLVGLCVGAVALALVSLIARVRGSRAD